MFIDQNNLCYTYENMMSDLNVIKRRYPKRIRYDTLTETIDGRQVWYAIIGNPDAKRKILVHGSIHGREHITSRLVMKQAETFLRHMENGESYRHIKYDKLLEIATVYVIPMVNPDGVSISQMGIKGIQTERVIRQVKEIARIEGESTGRQYFTHWKANGNGVDLNRNFDAGWKRYQDPVGHPASAFFKGIHPECERESAVLAALTRKEQFCRTISYHTQGNVIYWYFGQTGELYKDNLAFGRRISQVTGYMLEENNENLDPAGYKDWAICELGIPSLTIETGWGESPVSPGQWEHIWKSNKNVWEETLMNLEDRDLCQESTN
ncbi:MAG: M14 family metallocarboxypeptidase [Oliverpabstia sp.]